MMKRLALYIALIINLVLAQDVSAQEDVLFTNRQLRMAYTNPAYIPEILEATVTLGGRTQWRNIEGSPNTFFASARYFFIGAHSQVALSMLGDKIGYTKTTMPKLTYAYMVPFGEDCYLNLGVGAGFVSRRYDFDMMNTMDIKSENVAIDKLDNYTSPDAEAGFELLLQGLEVGASVNHLIATGEENQKMRKLYSGYVNYLMQSKEWWRLIPSYSFYKYEDRNKHQLSVCFQYLFDFEFHPKDLFYVGMAYRFNYEGSVLFGMNMFSFLSLGYSYDYFFGSLRHDNRGTHEIFLEFKIPQKFKGCFANYGKSHKYTRYTRIK